MNPRNIHAVMSENAYSVQVKFVTDNGNSGLSAKVYEYVTDIPNLKVGDYAVVMAPNFNSAVEDDNQLPKTVRIVAVDDGITFAPQDSKAYNWLVQKVDFLHYDMTQLAIKAAADEVKKAQRARMREVFKQQLMTEVLAAPAPVIKHAQPNDEDHF